MAKWSHYLDEDYDDQIKKVERIPHKPRKEELDKVRDNNRLKPLPAKKSKK